MGPRTSVTQQELLWYNCSPVCESPARRLYSGANVNLLTHYTSQDCCCQSPLACNRPLLTRASTRDTQTLKGRYVSVSCGGHCSFPWVLVNTRFCLCPPSISGTYELWFTMWLHPSYNLAAASLLPLDVGYLFFGGILHSPYIDIFLSIVVQQPVAILMFLLEKMSTPPSNPPSW